MKKVFENIIVILLAIAIAIIVVGLVCTVFTGVTWCLIAFVSWLFGVTIIPFYWIWIFAFILMLIGLFLE